jgi:DNA-binding HxlR family transcriptional regulator
MLDIHTFSQDYDREGYMTKLEENKKAVLSAIKSWKNPWTPTYHLRSVLGLSKSNADSQTLSRCLKGLEKDGLIMRALNRQKLYKLVNKGK